MPAMREQSVDARFWSRKADEYFANPIKDIEAYHEKLAATRAHLRADMDMLEFGCGTGGTALAHAPFVNSVHAIDISRRMIEIGRAQAEAQGVQNMRFDCLGFSDFEAAPASYDVILGLSILHLLEDRDAALAKVVRLLKPGGIFVSSTGCLGEGMSFFKWIAPLGRAVGLLPILKVFTENELINSLEGAGLDTVEHWRKEKTISVFNISRKPA